MESFINNDVTFVDLVSLGVNLFKVVRYSKVQKMSNFTFDAVLSNGWSNHGPTMFHMATVRHKRWDPCLLYRTSLILRLCRVRPEEVHV